MKVSVKVPATTANFGPGFDCFGMAIPIYNIITLEETVYPDTGLQIIYWGMQDTGISDLLIPKDEIQYCI